MTDDPKPIRRLIFVIEQYEGEGWVVTSPDMPGFVTDAPELDGALEMAAVLLREHGTLFRPDLEGCIRPDLPNLPHPWGDNRDAEGGGAS